MKEPLFAGRARAALNVFLALSFVLVLFSGINAQQLVETAEAASDAEAIQSRVTRARALAAVGKLTAAASELEALRASSADESVRDVARILLMGIYVEIPDYPKANALLEEAYKSRDSKRESSARSYYALAGQTVNSVRMHIERYRAFGINVADEELPGEVRNDLEHLRTLLERVLEQARAIREDEAGANSVNKGADATALIEEAASVRLRITRDEDDRAHWKHEISDARQRLVANETRIAKISETPAASAASMPATSTNPVATPAKESAANAPAGTVPVVLRQSASSFVMPGTDAVDKEASGPVAVGALHGKVERKVNPNYPTVAKAARISGVVTVYVVVDEKGSVVSVQRAEGPVSLQSAATDAVRRWKFKPTIVDGHPVRVSGYINFNFSL